MMECDTCANYTYDEEYEEYVCDVIQGRGRL